jgi:8-oxo-dGTP pyrophosphatase MutT (NUDIX family)
MAIDRARTIHSVATRRTSPGGGDALGRDEWHACRPPIERRDGAVARLRTATATSAGGVVIRTVPGRRELVAGMRRRDRDSWTWTLPKGTPNAGETLEETALREVAEETGLEVRIIEPVGSIEYWFGQRGARIHKTVHYFLMEAVGGDLARHDHEFERVEWIDVATAASTLTFETERDLVARTVDRLPPAPQVAGPTAFDAVSRRSEG